MTHSAYCPVQVLNKRRYYDLKATSCRIDAGARASKVPWRQRDENGTSFGFSSQSQVTSDLKSQRPHKPRPVQGLPRLTGGCSPPLATHEKMAKTLNLCQAVGAGHPSRSAQQVPGLSQTWLLSPHLVPENKLGSIF